MKKRHGCKMIRCAALFLSLVFGAAGCDVHEFPEVSNREYLVKVKCHLKFTDFIKWEHRYDENGVYEIGYGERYQNQYDRGVERHVIQAHPLMAKQASHDYATRSVFTHNIEDDTNDFTLDLRAGNYAIMVWSDIVRHNDDPYFYDTENFAEIRLQGEHCGNNDYRDAFRGRTDVFLPADIIDRGDIELDIDMQRPLAKYEFISTDLLEFIDKEFSRAEEKRRQEAAATKSAVNEADTRINIDEYKVVFYYVGFMPNAYSMFTDRPVDAATGVLFESKLKRISETEASVGFDYVFVNGTASAVTVQIGLYDNEGTQVSMTKPITVPIKRSHHTIMRGEFLTADASGGVNINPEYNGDHNIVIP